MSIDKKQVKLISDTKCSILADLILYEESPTNEDMVLIEIIIDGQKIIVEREDFFTALQDLRKELKKRSIQIACNGAARNVYPSPMQISMGSGRMAYRLNMGQQARNSDVVDIFDCDEDLVFVDIEEQSNYYAAWLKSIMG